MRAAMRVACVLAAIVPVLLLACSGGPTPVSDPGGGGGASSSGGSSGGSGSSGSGSGSSGSSGGASSSGGPTCSSSLSSGFAAAPSAFSVPAPRCQVSFDQLAQTSSLWYATMDMTSDAHPDLVVFHDDCDTTVGSTHWDVYPWGSSGFSPSPTPFSVPAPRCQVSFDQAEQTSSLWYATMDMTSDAHPDLVVFHDDCDATVGHTHWDVYPWTASGFSPSPAAFSVPAPRCQVSFDQAEQTSSLWYATMDMTGDGHPDLVVFHDDCDATVGQTHWDVYPWTASGFSPSPTAFSVPAPRCQVSFDETEQTSSLWYSTMDVTGDGHPDLVVFHDDCDATVGSTHWDIYPWTASGFAASPAAFSVPPPRCKVSFDEAEQTSSLWYSTMDVTGDSHPDLVVFHDDCDATVGSTHWDVYPWSASGFAASPTAFSVPPPRCQVSFDQAEQTSSLWYSTTKLTSTCTLGLVVSHDDCDTTVGRTHWDVYGLR